MQKVNTFIFKQSESANWYERFNDATFFNYDPVNPLYIGQWVLQPAVTITGPDAVDHVYPTFLEISLKEHCVNDTTFIVDTKLSATGNWWIIYTQYEGIE